MTIGGRHVTQSFELIPVHYVGNDFLVLILMGKGPTRDAGTPLRTFGRSSAQGFGL